MRSRSWSSVPSLALALTTAGLALAAGCGSNPGSESAVAGTAAAHPQAGSCTAGAKLLSPIGGLEQSNGVALGKLSEGPLKGKTLAFAADEDDHSIVVVDVDGRKELSKVKLSGAPGQVMVANDGRVLVTVRGANQLAVLHPAADGSLAKGCSVPTAAEPISIAVTPDSKTALVASGWGRAVESFDMATLTKKAKVDLPREPRSIVIDDAGQTAYVSHAMGAKLSLIDVATMRASKPLDYIVSAADMREDEERPFSLASAVTGAVGSGEKLVPGRFGTKMGCQGFPMVKSVEPKGRILAPQILVDPGDPENRAEGYGDAGSPTEVANVAVIDTGTKRFVRSSVTAVEDRHFFGGGDEPVAGECILPRAAAVDSKTSTLFVTCLGIDSVVAYDSASANPVAVEKARYQVASGPMGIAIESDKSRAIVWSQFERSIDVVDLAADVKVKQKADRIAMKAMDAPLGLGFVLGRQIFHAVGDARVSADGRSCASCHPDGRDDAITWATPDGPRRTIMLAGRLANTEPMSWNGATKDVRDHLEHTFERLDGQGLRNVELEALVSYIEALPTPPREHVADVQLVAKGKTVFNSAKTECANCHVEGGTDRRVHDLGTRVRADRKATFNTPSLSYLSGRGQFFHDGRYETLRDVLVQSDGQMGHTKHLSAGEMDALEAYLHSL